MGWDNPPVPWHEFERRLTWRARSANPPEPVGPLEPVGPMEPARALEPARAQHQEPQISWAELHCHSCFSFLDGASQPAELVAEAARRGVRFLALTDHDGMYGAAQFAQAAARSEEETGVGVETIFGAELSLGSAVERSGSPDPAGRHLLVLARDPEGYRRLCRVISTAQVAGGAKGRPHYDSGEIAAAAQGGHWVVLTGCRKGAVPAALAAKGPDAALVELRRLTEMFGRTNVKVELIDHDQPTDDERNDALYQLATQAGIEVVASSNVHYASPAQARLAQALAAIRARSSLDEMNGWLSASGSAYLRSGAEMAERLTRYPNVFARTVELADECTLNFEVITPELPDWPVPENHTEASWLRKLVSERAPLRYGPPHAERVPGAYRQIAHELDVIENLGFPGYFLIINDIVEFCTGRKILCQGRGSAANSAVCYALGITSVDAVRHGLLFERFLSAGRERHLLPPPHGAPRRRAGARVLTRATGCLVTPDRAGRARSVGRWRPRCCGPALRTDAAATSPPGHPLRRDGDLRPAGR